MCLITARDCFRAKNFVEFFPRHSFLQKMFCRRATPRTRCRQTCRANPSTTARVPSPCICWSPSTNAARWKQSHSSDLPRLFCFENNCCLRQMSWRTSVAARRARRNKFPRAPTAARHRRVKIKTRVCVGRAFPKLARAVHTRQKSNPAAMSKTRVCPRVRPRTICVWRAATHTTCPPQSLAFSLRVPWRRECSRFENQSMPPRSRRPTNFRPTARRRETLRPPRAARTK